MEDVVSETASLPAKVGVRSAPDPTCGITLGMLLLLYLQSCVFVSDTGVNFFTEMDLSIWDLPYTQDENSFPANNLAQNFYFNQKLDTIEEDAINERCCLQVLEILIAKADTEIVELEDDIVMQESQLARADEKWLDMCIAGLNKKIDHLGSLITALKNENVQCSGVHLQTNRKPSERIHEKLETPLRNFSSTLDKQPANSTLGSSKLAAAVRMKVETTDDHNLKDTETVGMNGSFSVQANVTVQTPSVVEERNHQKTDDYTITKGSSAKESHASEKFTTKVLDKSDIPAKLISASKRESPSHLNNLACAVLKSASTKPLKDKAHSCGTTKKKINISEDTLEDEMMQRRSNDERIIINSSPEVEETSTGKEPKPAGAILVTRLSAVKQEPRESGYDEQTQNRGKAGQTREKHTSNQLVSKKQTGAKSVLGIKGEEGLPTETGHTKKEDRSKQLEKLQGELLVKQFPKSQVLTVSKSNSKLSLKIEGQRLNFKCNVPSEMVKEPCLAKELGFKSPSGLKLKRQWKTESKKENGGDEFGYKAIRGSPETSSTSLIHMKKRRITSSTGPVLQENENFRDFQNRLVKSHDRSNQNVRVNKVENDELIDSTAFIVPSTNIADLEKMTINQLKAVAKQEKLRGIYKLRKAELQELLRFKLLAKGRST
ncbi:uncharacterized protein LOC132060041 isoform X2 [Lycium ferocissimum]|uniref:uncharacterized protein LOC132060041 isoform X2 n=1 Tax=Lycium ferocissimum TaxID=112874 RepID=UPI0028149E8F|nr:uncharacterized protein LOC132060041 isoform X2 [Lycium ferocissimum]